jgi:spore germination protein YaaH
LEFVATKKGLKSSFVKASGFAAVTLALGGFLTAGQTPEPNSSAKSYAALKAARQRVLGARPLAMYYITADPQGLESLKAQAAEMTVLGPQSFKVESDGVVRGEVPAEVLETARAANLPVMPLVVNAGFDRATASVLLRNPKNQERAAAFMAYLAKRDNYVGWQLDLENIDPADKALYTRFVRRVAAKLHADGRLLSIAVVPRFSDQYPDKRTAEFRTGQWGAPFDFRAIGKVVNFVVLMTYDHHTTGTRPGPVAGYAWLEEALEFAVRRVPRWKLVAGIPFYGREWVETAKGTISRSLPFRDLQALLEQPGVEVHWDERWRVPWFQFRVGPELHTVWFDDRRSFKEKLDLVRQYRLRGFAAWRLGSEDPEFWSIAEEMSEKLAVTAGRKPLQKPSRKAASGSSSRSR